MTKQKFGDGASVIKILLEELHKENERGAILLMVAYFDDMLKEIMFHRLAGSPKDKDKWFSNGPLKSFSSKIEMSYAMGLIPLNVRNACHDLRTLRNAVAHTWKTVNLSTESIHKKDTSFQDTVIRVLADNKLIQCGEEGREAIGKVVTGMPNAKTQLNLLAIGIVAPLNGIMQNLKKILPQQNNNGGQMHSTQERGS